MARKWTREEEILALVLYCELPFGKVHSSNPEIKKLSALLDRTPASVSMKMCNFARFDPALQNRGVSGLANGSKLDKEIWNEFNGRWSELVKECREIQERLGLQADDEVNHEEENEIIANLPMGETRQQMVQRRLNQRFFRQAVLSAYENRCCITGLAIPELLVASHIKPWSKSDPIRERTNPTNGLCLNALHDKAFDRGLITVTLEYRIVVSSQIREQYSEVAVQRYFQSVEGKSVTLPSRFVPATEFLEYHNHEIFIP